MSDFLHTETWTGNQSKSSIMTAHLESALGGAEKVVYGSASRSWIESPRTIAPAIKDESWTCMRSSARRRRAAQRAALEETRRVKEEATARPLLREAGSSL
jgi:hypothetical protein